MIKKVIIFLIISILVFFLIVILSKINYSSNIDTQEIVVKIGTSTNNIVHNKIQGDFSIYRDQNLVYLVTGKFPGNESKILKLLNESDPFIPPQVMNGSIYYNNTDNQIIKFDLVNWNENSVMGNKSVIDQNELITDFIVKDEKLYYISCLKNDTKCETTLYIVNIDTGSKEVLSKNFNATKIMKLDESNEKLSVLFSKADATEVYYKVYEIDLKTKLISSIYSTGTPSHNDYISKELESFEKRKFTHINLDEGVVTLGQDPENSGLFFGTYFREI